jgi:hypothetical protein
MRRIASRPGEIDRLVFLGGSPNGPAEKLKSSSLFIVARDDSSGDGRTTSSQDSGAVREGSRTKSADHS